ncbi:MAG: hypothetical protein KA797_09480 [Chitinophagales bacterium]|nr:hypothetical protein [Chitinophagales bacterium]
MSTTDIIRNELIGKLLGITNKDYLSALNKIVDSHDLIQDEFKLTEEQKLMLELSEVDIRKGNLIDHSDLMKNQLEWLKGK